MAVERDTSTKENRAYWRGLDNMLRCKTHPKYRIARQPKVACERCWDLWFTFRHLRDK